MHHPTPVRLALALVATAFAGTAHAQTDVIDEGSFRLSIRGTPVGTETFSIRRSGTGAGTTVVVQGRVVLDSGEQTEALLQVEGPGLRPSAYQIQITGPERQTIRGQAAGNRFRAQIVSTAGEMMREYLASDGAVVIENGVAHHYYFLVDRADQGGAVPIILPRQSRQITARVSAPAAEAIEIAGQQVAASRYQIEPQGLAARIVWVDRQGRVLRLRIPDEGFIAERTSLP